MKESKEEKMINNITIKEVQWGTPEYKQEVELRCRVFDKNHSQLNLDREVEDYHFCAFLGSELVGCFVLTEVDDGTVQMRQVAVDESLRGKNVGRQMLVFAEEFAKEAGFSRIVLKSRKHATPFYEKHNYIQTSEEFMEAAMTAGMTYIEMTKVVC